MASEASQSVSSQPTTAPASATNSKQVSPKISIPLPSAYAFKRVGRFCWYGYNVSHDWLMAYARGRLISPDREEADSLQLLVHARNVLRRKSKIGSLELCIARRDKTTPPDPGLTQIGNISILSICSAGGTTYRNRPTQKQVDRLTEIVGCQPRWWVDGEKLESY